MTGRVMRSVQPIYRERSDCRAGCGVPLVEVLDLGATALANDFHDPAAPEDPRRVVPLRLNLCPVCSFVQLREVVDPEVLYSNYAYVSSTSRTMDGHLERLADTLLEGIEAARPRVLEIASNTGIFLKKFAARGCEVLGIEPAGNISTLAEANGIPTRTEFFDIPNAERLARKWGEADLIVGRHVFAHIDDLKSLLRALEKISHDQTAVAFEVPYLVDFFEKVEFDTIYHEHLSYISVRALHKLVEGTPFMIQRVDRFPIHGGSIVFTMRHRDSGIPLHASVEEALWTEKEIELARLETWKQFAARVRKVRDELPALVRSLRNQGKRVVGYGASAKGNTLLQSSGLSAGDLDYIIDNTPFKQGKVAPGSRIPVVAPDKLMQDRPDYALLLAWNFADEIVGREQGFQAAGGRFIVPIPEPQILPFPSKRTA